MTFDEGVPKIILDATTLMMALAMFVVCALFIILAGVLIANALTRGGNMLCL